MSRKRLLIISHNCLSQSGSNGRTLANYLIGWPKENIAQFYIHAEQPDFNICNQYFCITDLSVLKSIINRKSAGYIVEDRDTNINAVQPAGKKKKMIKNSLFFLLREFAWRSRFWNSNGFEKWVESFSPELILVQAGDAGFLFTIAVAISKKFQAPIVVYNTEGYYFKKTSYLSENVVSRPFYRSLNRNFRKSYDTLVNASKAEIYNCDLLRDDYKNIFHNDSRVIMNASEFTEEEVTTDKKKQIIYAGNLGVNRHKSLIEFANVLKKVAPDMIIDVYGKIPDDTVKNELESCTGIKLHAFIPYKELQQKLRESKYLLHIESFDPFYKEDLKYAFSTKIADSLAVGSCLFVYAPENMAVIRYLKGKEAAVLITDPKMLEEQISLVLSDDALSHTYAENARMLAMKHHNIRKNREEFQSVLLG